MSLLDFSQVPGYAEAANREQVNRDMAFMPAPLPVCGVAVRHMNARHHIMLCGCRNRFITGGSIRPEDVAMWLWFLSPGYTTEAGFREAFIAEKVRPLDFAEVSRAIIEYREQVYQDWPASDGLARKLYVAPVATMVDLLAHEYGWSDESILEMPLARIFQYVRRINMRRDPGAVMFNPSDRLMSEYLMARMAAN